MKYLILFFSLKHLFFSLNEEKYACVCLYSFSKLFCSFFYLFFYFFWHEKFLSLFNVLVNGTATLSGGKAWNRLKSTMRNICGTFFRDHFSDKKHKKSLYHLFSRKSNRKRRIELFVITRSKSTFVGVRKLCFTCYEYRESASNAYNCRGVARWCEERTRRKLPDRMNVFWQGQETKFHETAAGLYMKIGYEVHDAFTADIYYHNSCYIEFILKKNGASSRRDCWITWEWYTWQVFVSVLKKRRLVHEKDAFLFWKISNV